MDYLIKATVVIALFYVCYYVLLRKETFFQQNRWFLLSGLVIALIFPLIVIPVQIYVTPQIAPLSMYAIQESAPSSVIENTAPIPATIDWLQIIFVTYVIGLGIFLTQFLFQFGSLLLLVLKNPKDKDGIYTYVIVKHKVSPFSFFKWIVYNPNSFRENELDLILTHEKVHVNQWHSVDIIFTQLACTLFWFNPLIWLYRKDVIQNLEYIADNETQSISDTEKEYQHLLLKTSINNHNISLSNNFYNSLIKERIVMLKKSRSNKRKQWKYVLMLPVLAGLLMSMNTEKVYIETEYKTTTSIAKLEFIVSKNTTDKELVAMSTAVENKGAVLKFSKIKRNASNELTGIFVQLNNRSYANNQENEPIESFLIYKELSGLQGGYVGRLSNGTKHFDIENVFDEAWVNDLKAFEKRLTSSIMRNGLFDKNKSSDSTKQIELIFTKNMTDQELDEIKKELMSNGIEMKLKRIKRNSKGEISDINIDFKTENGSANYNVNDDNGIKPFFFRLYNDSSFGVGAVREKEVVIVENISIDDLEKSKSNVFIHKNDDNHEIIEIIEDSTDNSEIRIIKGNGYILNNSTNKNGLDSVRIVTGYKFNFKSDTIRVVTGFKIDSTEIKRLYKDATNSPQKTYYYYKDESPTRIISSEVEMHKINDNSLKNISYFTDQSPKPLVIVGGKILGIEKMKSLNPKDIESMSVLKGQSAINRYGDKGKNGVIVIKLKNGKSSETKNPWKITTGVTSVTYFDDKDTSKNASVAYISKFTSDKILQDHKTNLKKLGIAVKYSKLRRNSAGEITSIKISLKDNEGKEASAKFKSDDGIDGVRFGLSEGSLIVSTSYKNKFD